MRRNFFLFCVLFFLSACAMSRVTVDNYESDKVVIHENSSWVDSGAMEKKAKEVCATYNKKAILVKLECAAGGGEEHPLFSVCAKRGFYACN